MSEYTARMRAGGSSGGKPSPGAPLHQQIQGGLLPLDLDHPSVDDIFRKGNIDQDYEVEKEPIAR